MKLPQSDHPINRRDFNIFHAIIPLICGIFVLFSACENDIEKVKLMMEDSNFPDQSMINAEIIHTVNGRLKVRITAPEINRFIGIKEPHTIFPLGLNVSFYDSTSTEESKISANYAIYYENDETWEARNDVVTINNQGDTLNTELLIWNQSEAIIHTDKYVKITTKDGIIHGKGFEANQDFSNWKIKETTGSIEVHNE